MARKLPGGTASIRSLTSRYGSSSAGMQWSTAISITAVGWPRSSSCAASARIFPVSRASASISEVGAVVLVSRARAWLSTIGSEDLRARSSLADCPAEPRAGHPGTARPSRDCPRSRGTFFRSSDSRPYAGERASRRRRVLAHTRRQGDNDGMARDDSKALLRLAFMPLLDGGRPSGTRGWVNPVTPVVTQAAAGAGHWAACRRQRALAEWAGAAGFGLVAWGLGTEAPTRAEALENFTALAGLEGRQREDFLRKLEAGAPATAAAENTAARRVLRFFRWFGLVSPVADVVLSVPWRLRHPRRLTALAIANEAPNVAFNVLRAARAVQRRRPRMAAGSESVGLRVGVAAAV